MKQASLLVIVIVALAVFLGFALGSPLLGPLVGADTDGRRTVIGVEDSCTQGWLDFQIKGHGVMSDAETDSRQEGEAFTQTIIYFAWLKDGRSQEIVGEVKIQDCGFGPSQWPDQAYYYFYLNGKLFYHADIPNGYYFRDLGATFGNDGPLGLFSFHIRGFRYCTVPVSSDGTCASEADILDGSVLRVDVHVSDVGPGGYDKVFVFRDELTLRSAVANVWFDKSGYVVEEDEVAFVNWKAPTATYQECSHTGTCATRPAYALEVIHENTGNSLYGPTPITTAGGRIGIVLSPSLYSDSDTAINQLKAVLYTEIAEIDEDFTASASLNGPERPVVTSVSLSPSDIRQGDTVKVSWKTSGTVTRVRVVVHISGNEVYRDFVAGDATEITFQANVAGFGTAFVTAYNGANPSDVSKTDFSVGPTYERGNLGDLGANWIPLLAAAGVFIVGLLVSLPVVKNPRIFLIALAMLALLATGVYVVVGGLL